MSQLSRSFSDGFGLGLAAVLAPRGGQSSPRADAKLETVQLSDVAGEAPPLEVNVTDHLTACEVQRALIARLY